MRLTAKVVGLATVLILVSMGVSAVAFLRLDALYQAGTARTSEIARQTLLARTIQVNFKKQVQEWKDILLRGHDPADFAKYHELFLRREADVARDTQQLATESTAVPVRTTLEKFRLLHLDLSPKYRLALEAFRETGDAHAADRMVRGLDRPPTDVLDAAVVDLENLQQATAVGLAARWSEGWRDSLVFTGISLLVLLVTIGGMGISITHPIINLAGLMRRITRDNSFRESLSCGRKDEIGQLYAAFNDMLKFVRERDETLVQERNTLAERAERLRALTQSASDGILSADSAGTVLSWNRAASDILGYTPEEMLCKPLLRVVASEHQAGVSDAIAELVERGRAEPSRRILEIEALRKDTTRVILTLSLSTWKSGDDVYLGAILRDITEQKKVARLKDEFISTVNHELRTPLTAIRGSLGLLAGGVLGVLPPQARAMVELAHKNCGRLSRLVNDILDMEKMESGKLEFHMKPQDLRTLTQQAIEATRSFAEPLGVTCHLEDGPAAAAVMADPDRILQVLVNLISNACKFSPRGERVALDVSADQGVARVRVSDRGPGIPDEFRKRIFQKFAQAETSDARVRQGQGTGLGLSISKAIVERHDGGIGFDTIVGRGTTFHFTLPLATAAVAPVRTPAKPYIAVCGLAEAAVAQAREAAALFDLETEVFPDSSAVRDLAAEPGCRCILLRETAGPAMPAKCVIVADSADRRTLAALLQSRLAAGESRAARILHVDAQARDRDSVREALGPLATLVPAGSLDEAWKELRRSPVDLLLLDLYLPDGCSLDLLPVLHGLGLHRLPILVLSDSRAPKKTPATVKAVLGKSATSPEQLLATVRAVLHEGRLPGRVSQAPKNTPFRPVLAR